MDSDDFLELTANEWLALNYALTIFLANGLNSNQLNVIGNFLCAVGQNMLLLQSWLGSCPNPDAVYFIDNRKIVCTAATNKASSETESTAIQKKLTLLENQLNSLTALLFFEETQNKPDDDANSHSN